MKKKSTVKELQAILDSPEGTYKTYVKKDGSLDARKVSRYISKIQIVRVLKDHNQYSLTELQLDNIAQTLIEHSKEVLCWVEE